MKGVGEDYLRPPASAADSGEMRFYFTMLFEAVQLVLYEANRPVRSPEWLEDFLWIFSNEQHPTSFLCLASLLDINSEWVRELIYDALSKGDQRDAPTLAHGRKRCQLAGLIVLDEARTRAKRVEAAA